MKNSILALLLLALILVAGGFYIYNREDVAVEPHPSTDKKRNFTLKRDDISAISNGNIQTCIEMFDWIKASGKQTDTMVAGIDTANFTEISRQPFNAIGRLFLAKGKVYKVEQLQPGSYGSANTWTSILLFVKNKNATLGTSTVEFVYNGDISQIQSDYIIEIRGYFAGKYSGENSMGGTDEGYLFVGNKAKFIRRYRAY